MNWQLQEFDIYFEALIFFVNILNYKEYEDYLEKSVNAIKRRDIKDADYIACALAINADFIWTEDKDFSEQKLAKIKNTTQFIEENR